MSNDYKTYSVSHLDFFGMQRIEGRGRVNVSWTGGLKEWSGWLEERGQGSVVYTS